MTDDHEPDDTFDRMRSNGRSADDWLRDTLDRAEAEANLDPEVERRNLAAQLFGRPDTDDDGPEAA